MKVIMEFMLPDDAEDLRRAQNGPHYRAALQAVRDELRRRLKYESPPAAARAALQEINALLLSEVQDLGEEF